MAAAQYAKSIGVALCTNRRRCGIDAVQCVLLLLPCAGLSHWLPPSVTTNSRMGVALLPPCRGMLVDIHLPGADVTCGIGIGAQMVVVSTFADRLSYCAAQLGEWYGSGHGHHLFELKVFPSSAMQ